MIQNDFEQQLYSTVGKTPTKAIQYLLSNCLYQQIELQSCKFYKCSDVHSHWEVVISLEKNIGEAIYPFGG